MRFFVSSYFTSALDTFVSEQNEVEAFVFNVYKAD
jgi:hypothetical protein